MKSFITVLAIVCLLACGTSSSKDSPSAIENSTQHPNGVTNDAVISTDTASIAGDSSQQARDARPNKK